MPDKPLAAPERLASYTPPAKPVKPVPPAPRVAKAPPPPPPEEDAVGDAQCLVDASAAGAPLVNPA